MVPREFSFSRHFQHDKDVEIDLAKDCVHTGKKERQHEADKFIARKKYRKGELIVVYKELDDRTFIITAFWNQPGGRQP
ncbi:hypothetical protein HY994_01995 [Candidatus Micrarchaeota archaeon]|nr:hypothetical protein [Candidatus Micrarchaeota archaeon]